MVSKHDYNLSNNRKQGQNYSIVNTKAVKEVFLHARHKQNMAIMVMASNTSMESSIKSTESSNNELRIK